MIIRKLFLYVALLLPVANLNLISSCKGRSDKNSSLESENIRMYRSFRDDFEKRLKDREYELKIANESLHSLNSRSDYYSLRRVKNQIVNALKSEQSLAVTYNEALTRLRNQSLVHSQGTMSVSIAELDAIIDKLLDISQAVLTANALNIQAEWSADTLAGLKKSLSEVVLPSHAAVTLLVKNLGKPKPQPENNNQSPGTVASSASSTTGSSNGASSSQTSNGQYSADTGRETSSSMSTAIRPSIGKSVGRIGTNPSSGGTIISRSSTTSNGIVYGRYSGSAISGSTASLPIPKTDGSLPGGSTSSPIGSKAGISNNPVSTGSSTQNSSPNGSSQTTSNASDGVANTEETSFENMQRTQEYWAQLFEKAKNPIFFQNQGKLISKIAISKIIDESLTKDATAFANAIVGAFENVPEINAMLTSDSGVYEQFSIRTHTKMVLGIYHSQMNLYPVLQQTKTKIDLVHLMPVVMVMHDLAKGIANARQEKHLQHAYSTPVARAIMKAMGYSSVEVDLAAALIDNDIYGEAMISTPPRWSNPFDGESPRLLSTGIDLVTQSDMISITRSLMEQNVLKSISSSTNQPIMPLPEYGQLQRLYYVSDAASYPNLMKRVFTTSEHAPLCNLKGLICGHNGILETINDWLVHFAKPANERGTQPKTPRLMAADLIEKRLINPEFKNSAAQASATSGVESPKPEYLMSTPNDDIYRPSNGSNVAPTEAARQPSSRDQEFAEEASKRAVSTFSGIVNFLRAN
ncbi:MAG: hypothetical protein NT027_16630 [Proteobacteria bacterium]|nr:hypothetical protein [Pseudomonadota bacterium]